MLKGIIAVVALVVTILLCCGIVAVFTGADNDHDDYYRPWPATTTTKTKTYRPTVKPAKPPPAVKVPAKPPKGLR